MKNSTYLPLFLEGFSPEIKEGFTLNGASILIQRIPKEEIKKGGIIIQADDKIFGAGIGADLPTWVQVLMVGEGYYDDETEEDVVLEVSIGDVLLIPENSIKWISVLGPLVPTRGEEMGIAAFSSSMNFHFKGVAGFNALTQELGKRQDSV